MIKDIDNDIANLYQIKKHLIEKEDKKKIDTDKIPLRMKIKNP